MAKLSQMTKYGKQSTNTSRSLCRELEIEGLKIELHQTLLGQRADTIIIPAEEVAKIPAERLLNVSDVPAEPFPVAEPPFSNETLPEVEGTPAAVVENDEHVKWRQDSENWAKMQESKQLKKVVYLAPVLHTTKVLCDKQPLKIFHTLRGPVIGVVTSEDMYKAYLYSPAFIDPNIQEGRVHYIPIAFGGFEYTLYKTNCIGESVPQEAEVSGYPTFVKHNKEGDYQFRMRCAYHHIEADLPADAHVVSVPTDVRMYNEGLIPTSDTKEETEIAKARQLKAMQAQAEQAQTTQEQAPPEA